MVGARVDGTGAGRPLERPELTGEDGHSAEKGDLQRLREALPFPPFLPEVGRPLLRQVSGNKDFRRKQSAPRHSQCNAVSLITSITSFISPFSRTALWKLAGRTGSLRALSARRNLSFSSSTEGQHCIALPRKCVLRSRELQIHPRTQEQHLHMGPEAPMEAVCSHRHGLRYRVSQARLSGLPAHPGEPLKPPASAASGVLVLPFRPKRLLDRDPGRSLRVVSARQTSVLFCVCPAAMPKDRERRSPSPTPTGPTSGTPARAPRVPAGLEAPVLPLLYENTPPRH
ncbi:hypothetical protein MG293_017829 [Ovis ammon polii]|uniref:Uncharacterized protein n=1 Tax=Ovis ammon polii TaxID=230172 RepID=A0AAD4TUM2_OVIAM|nr:hypothetical protein MG293_017829 [Ovis ammon polii]